MFLLLWDDLLAFCTIKSRFTRYTARFQWETLESWKCSRGYSLSNDLKTQLATKVKCTTFNKNVIREKNPNVLQYFHCLWQSVKKISAALASQWGTLTNVTNSLAGRSKHRINSKVKLLTRIKHRAANTTKAWSISQRKSISLKFTCSLYRTTSHSG